ncbi:MAG TPA: hypothetical protein VFV94_08520, partial [Polyangiaceae bacterium]|nr:hypothetical protein [Polyangiaceae bacterium]
RADLFRNHNLRTLEDVLPHWQNEEARTNLARSAREQLERQMEEDRASMATESGHGWHSELEGADEERA